MADQPRKFLFVSIDALIGDIAWQVTKEGNDVRFFIESESERTIADGLVPKVDDWESHVDWADVIVFDDVLGQGTKAKALRDAGKHVVGGTPYTDQLEDDRSFGQEELKRHGVSIIPFKDFSTSTARSSTSPVRRRRMSSSPAARPRTSSACCSSARKMTAVMSFTCCSLTRRPTPTPSRCSSCSAACAASR
jgi:hypothetical protein